MSSDLHVDADRVQTGVHDVHPRQHRPRHSVCSNRPHLLLILLRCGLVARRLTARVSTPTASSPVYMMFTQPSFDASTNSDISA